MLAIEKIFLILIFLIVLALALYFLFGIGKGAADQLLLQNELRQCCGKYRAYNCTVDPTSIDCDGKTLEDVRVKLGITVGQLNSSCYCP